MDTPQDTPVQLGKPIPGNRPVAVPDTSIAPYHFTGLLEVTFPNGRKNIGTGILIAEPGKEESRYVLTCAHNLYDLSEGGKATKVEFRRGYNEPSSPFESTDGADFFYPSGYPDEVMYRPAINSLDYGLVKLRAPIRLNGLPAPLVKRREELENMPVQLNGYGWFKKQMSHATGKLDGYTTPTALRYPISTIRGAAGSAIMAMDNQTIVGIHIGEMDDKMLNKGLRITDSMLRQIREWMR
jgi:V8-like Glu-specific endopeptidase